MTLPAPPFLDRNHERALLHDILRSPQAQLFILYGRRGVGKSALLNHSLAETGSSYLYYRATRRTLPLQLDALTAAAREAFPDAFLAQPFSSVSTFLDFLAYQARTTQDKGSNPVTTVIDELPYLADVEPGLLTTLQHWWDQNRVLRRLRLILCGSLVSFMEREVLNVNAPLHNRRTGSIKLAPMDYAEASLFFPSYSSEQKMIAYAILGGMPSYLVQFNSGRTIEENVKETVLRQDTYLSEEPDWLLLEDLRKDLVYGSTLRAIAMGARRPSEIARAIGKQSAQDMSQTLATLIDLDLVTREVPVTERRNARSRHSLYAISDQYLEFWYRYVDPNRSLVTRGLGERVWDRSIAPSLHEYVSKPAFERACRQYVWRALSSGRLPDDCVPSEVGAWWGARDREIDVVGLDDRDRVTITGSCKWTSRPVDVAEYAALLKDSEALLEQQPAVGQVINLMFSRSGFAERLKRIASSQSPPRLLLVDIGDLYSV